jgi:outer membrane protein OmpA-like peptidoglycan-associated protein
LLLPVNSWKQDKTTVKFAAPGHAVGNVLFKLSTGLAQDLPAQKFEYRALSDLCKEIGICGDLTCLGTFDKACSMDKGAAQPVSFKVGSNALSPKSIKVLKSWKLEKAKSVIIYGYASKAGTKALNAKLTKKRAAEVGAWVKKNWPNLTVKSVGLGTITNRLCKPYDNKCAIIKITALKK